MEITLQIIHCLQFAAWIEQTADDDVPEHLVPDGVVTDTVEERAEYKFRADYLNLGVVQRPYKVVYHILFFNI